MKKLLLLTSIVFILSSCGPQGSYPNLTQCMQKNGVVMFGASWCPHCANQKNLFANSKKDMPYFECDSGKGQVKECGDRDIVSYPTWQFPDTIIRALPKEALAKLFQDELTKAQGMVSFYKDAVKEKPELLVGVEKTTKKIEALAVSKLSDYEKLSQLPTPSEDASGSYIERPAYTLGRIAGELTLPEIALYSGCSTEYQKDLTDIPK